LLAIVPLLLFPFLFTLLLFLLRDLFGALVWAIGCAVVLKTMFAINAMGKHTRPIQEALERNDMEAARKAASMIVSRDVNKLDRETHHLLRGRVGGGEHRGQHLLAAVLLRSGRNAADRLLPGLEHPGRDGRYIDPPYTHVGWFSAKLDDCTNYICARISLPFILLALIVLGMDWRRAWRDARKYHRATLSPNKGWSMSAFAGGLGIRFEKTGWYVMGDGPLPTDRRSSATRSRS